MTLKNGFGKCSSFVYQPMDAKDWCAAKDKCEKLRELAGMKKKKKQLTR